MPRGRQHDPARAEGVADDPRAPAATGMAQAAVSDVVSLSALDPSSRGRAIGALQSGAGNQAVARLLSVTGGAGPAKVMRVVKSDDRFARIRTILEDWLVGPFDERELQKAWQAFGRELPAAVAVEPELWKTSLERGMDPRRIAGCGVADLPMHFQQDVIDVARQNAAANRALVKKERRRLGLPEGLADRFKPLGPEGTALDLLRETELEDVQQLSARAAELLAGQRALREIHVGWDHPPAHLGNKQGPRRTTFYEELRLGSAELMAEARQAAKMAPSENLEGMLDDAVLGHLRLIRATNTSLQAIVSLKIMAKAAEIGEDAGKLYSEDPSLAEPEADEDEVILLDEDEDEDDVILLDDRSGGGTPAPDASRLLAAD